MMKLLVDGTEIDYAVGGYPLKNKRGFYCGSIVSAIDVFVREGVSNKRGEKEVGILTPLEFM